MAFATISLIAPAIEPWFWLAIFVFCAYVIAKVATGKYFLHGFFVSLFNCVWIIAVHVAFAKTYTANHIEMATSMPPPLSTHPRIAMLVTGPIIGILSGLILGLFSLIASKIVKKKELA